MEEQNTARSLINNENFRSIVLEHKNERDKRSNASLTVAVPEIFTGAPVSVSKYTVKRAASMDS